MNFIYNTVSSNYQITENITNIHLLTKANRIADVYQIEQKYPNVHKTHYVYLNKDDMLNEDVLRNIKLISQNNIGNCSVTFLCPDISAMNMIISFGGKVGLNSKITSWSEFFILRDYYSVSTIIVGGDLLLQANDLKSNKKDMCLIVNPIDIQTEHSLINPSIGDLGLTGIFIRPEDIYRYENIIDVLWFGLDNEKENTLVSVYTHGFWEEDLAILIPQLPKVDNAAIPTSFGDRAARGVSAAGTSIDRTIYQVSKIFTDVLENAQKESANAVGEILVKTHRDITKKIEVIDSDK